MEHLKSLDQIENLHQQFFRSVEVAQDGFTAVADFFAKGKFLFDEAKSCIPNAEQMIGISTSLIYHLSKMGGWSTLF